MQLRQFTLGQAQSTFLLPIIGKICAMPKSSPESSCEVGKKFAKHNVRIKDKQSVFEDCLKRNMFWISEASILHFILMISYGLFIL